MTSIGVALLNQLMNLDIQAFAIWYVVPIGAAAVGALATCGVFIGRKLAKAEFRPYHYLIAAILGAASFLAVTFVDYQLAVNDVNKELAAYKAGEQYQAFTNEQKELFDNEFSKKTSFGSYLTDLKDNSEFTINNRGSSKATKISNTVFSQVSFWLSFVGGALGGLIVTAIAIGDRTKCKKCRIYRDKQVSNSVDEKAGEELKGKLEKLGGDGKDLVDILNKYPNNKFKKKVSYYTYKIMHCRSCKTGEVILEHYAFVGSQQKKTEILKESLTENQLQPVIVFLGTSAKKS